MSIIEINWKPTHRQLRQFGVICLFALPFIGWMWGQHWRWILGLAGAGGVIAALGWVAPAVVRPIYLALTLLTAPLGLVIGELLMVIVYYGVVCPLGLCGRLVGRDKLRLKVDRSTPSYWQRKKPPSSVRSYYRQS